MLQEIMRSTLILGTVLVTGVQAGRPSNPVDLTQQPTAPLVPISREITPSLANKLTFKVFEVDMPKVIPTIKSVGTGLATWYGMVRNGHHTANGEIFDCDLMTAASNILPFGTRVKVTNLKTGKSVVVRINDRGILSPGHVIDVTSAAAEQIGLLKMGIAPVHLDVLSAAL